MTGKQFRDRVLAVHQKHTSAGTEYGAMTWFGNHCGRTRRSIYRWGSSEIVDGEPVRILRILEALPAGTPWARDPALLDEALPVGFPAREALRKAGLRSQADVFHATDQELLAVSGVGPLMLTNIRTWWERQEEATA